MNTAQANFIATGGAPTQTDALIARLHEANGAWAATWRTASNTTLLLGRDTAFTASFNPTNPVSPTARLMFNIGAQAMFATAHPNARQQATQEELDEALREIEMPRLTPDDINRMAAIEDERRTEGRPLAKFNR